MNPSPILLAVSKWSICKLPQAVLPFSPSVERYFYSMYGIPTTIICKALYTISASERVTHVLTSDVEIGRHLLWGNRDSFAVRWSASNGLQALIVDLCIRMMKEEFSFDRILVRNKGRH